MTGTTTTKPVSSLAALGLLTFVGTLLAFSLIVGKAAIIEGAQAMPFLFFAMLGASITLFLIARIRREDTALNRRTLEYGLAAGFLFALPNAIGFLAVNHVGAGFISLTYAFPILVTYIIALGLRMEGMVMLRALGVLTGLAGGIILGFSKASVGDAPFIWVALALAAPVVIAIGNIYRTLRWPVGVSPIVLASFMLFGSALFILPFALSDGFSALFSVFQGNSILGLLIGQILVFSALYIAYFVLQKLAGPVYLSQIGSVAAIAGPIMGVAIFAESLPPNIAIAGGLIALAMYLFQRGTRLD